MIKLDDFLGLDKRGNNAFSSLRKSVYKKNSDMFGDANGIGPLSYTGRVNVELNLGDEIGRRT